MPYKFEGDTLVMTVPSQLNDDSSFGSTHYSVSVDRARGGRISGKGRKDKLGVDFFFQCSCVSYNIHKVCKHIGCIAIVHFTCPKRLMPLTVHAVD